MMTYFQQKISDVNESIKRSSERIAEYLKADQILSGIDLSDVDYSYVSSYGQDFDIELSLHEDRRDSKLPHKICQALGITMEKSQSYTGDSLIYKGTLESEEFGRVTISVRGVIPSTCHIEEETRELTDEEFEKAKEAALKYVSRTRTTKKIVCVE